MSEKKIESEVIYEVEDAKPSRAKGFWKSRAVKVTGITVGAAIALVGSFGLGVIAGEKIDGDGPTSMSQGEHFGPGMGFPKGFGDGDHRPPGGPHDDDDHGGFQMPETAPTPLTTP